MSTQIGSPLLNTQQSLANMAFHRDLLEQLATMTKAVHLGGGEKAIQKHKSKQKLTARERINLLID
ncbi:MAG: acyl-CoA carboxylase subunit beta, partial [Ignavibacteria bacterium]